MFIEFGKIRYKNFLSSGNTFLEFDFKKTKSTLIVGTNGVGKTTMLEALCFVLYGKPYRDLVKAKLINSINKKQARVEIEFSIGKDEYKIIRQIKPDKFEIYKNSSLIEIEADARAYQNMLESQILGMNYKSFCQIVILGSGGYIPFMQLKTEARRAIIEDLLDLKVFSLMNVILTKKKREHKEELDRLDRELELLKDKVEMQEKHLASMTNLKEQEKEDLKSEIEQVREYRNSRKEEFSALQDQIKVKQEELNSLSSSKKKLSDVERIDLDFQSRFREMKKNKSFFEENDVCPSCKQDIDHDHKKMILSTFEEKEKELKEGQDKLALKKQEYEERVEKFNTISDKISDLQMEIGILQSKIEHYNNHEEKILDKLSKIGDDKNTDTELASELKINRKKLAKVKKHYNEHVEKGDVLNISTTLLKDNGIKSKIVKQYVPVINKLVNKYLEGLNFPCDFNLDENFEETIKSRNRDSFVYNSFSEGQKARIDLALLFTWRELAKIRNSASTNLLIFDEVFEGSMDETGLSDFQGILERELKNVHTFVISPKGEQLADNFDRVLYFSLENNFTKVTEDE